MLTVCLWRVSKMEFDLEKIEITRNDQYGRINQRTNATEMSGIIFRGQNAREPINKTAWTWFWERGGVRGGSERNRVHEKTEKEVVGRDCE